MAIIATGSEVVFRYAGREVRVNKSQIGQRGQETKREAEQRVENSVKGTDRNVVVDLAPPIVYWQGPVGKTKPPAIKIPDIMIPVI